MTGKRPSIAVTAEAMSSPRCAQKLPLALGLELNQTDAEALVVTVTVAWCVPLTVSKEGEIAQCTPGGSPPQDNVTLWLKPPCGINRRENVALPRERP